MRIPAVAVFVMILAGGCLQAPPSTGATTAEESAGTPSAVGTSPAVSMVTPPTPRPELDRLVVLDPAAIRAAVESGSNVTLPLGPEDVVAHLEAHNVRAPGFKCIEAAGNGTEHEIECPPPWTYRGFLVDRPDVTIAASLTNESTSAQTFVTGGSGWGLQPCREPVQTNGTRLHWAYAQNRPNTPPPCET